MRERRIVAIVQQRMESNRLPYKAMLPLAGKPMTQHILERLKRAKTVHEVVLAIPEEKDHKMLLKVAEDSGVPCFLARGIPAEDLLERHTLAAQKFDADLVVRVPGDNPCVDPKEVDRIVEVALTRVLGWKQLFSNIQPLQGNGYPDGVGAEVYHYAFLKWLNENIREPHYKEHPHLWAYDNKKVWTIVAPRAIRAPEVRLDINTQEDYEYIEDIYNKLYPANPYFGTREILEYLNAKKQPHDLEERAIPAGGRSKSVGV